MNALNKNYKLLIFDWDGTLGDSSNALVASFKDTAVEFGLDVPSNEAIIATFGMKAAGCIKALYPNLTNVDAAIECFYGKYLLNIKEEALFAGAEETLRNLHKIGYKLAIATNKRRKALSITLQHRKIEDLFVALRCGDDEYCKPNPEVLFTLLQELDLNVSDAVMIGDTATDMEVAKAAGVDAIAACYGTAKKDELIKYSPVACIDSLSELRVLFTKPEIAID